MSVEENVESGVSKEKKSFILPIALGMLFLVSTILFTVYWYYQPGLKTVAIDEDTWTLVYNDKLFSDIVLVEDGQVLLAANFIQEYLDPHLFWDVTEETVTITTADKHISMATDNLTAYINRDPVEISASLTMLDDMAFLPINFLKEVYGITLEIIDPHKRVVISKESMPIVVGSVLTDTGHLRTSPSIRSPRIETLSAGQSVNIFNEENDFYRVVTATGIVGYIDKNHVQFKGVILNERQEQERFSWKPIGEKINLTWEFVHKRTTNPDRIGYLPGVNVVSPTWFHLQDEEGNIENNADLNYVNWAHDQGYQVWGLITNQFDRDLTHAVLSSTEKRKRVIDQLLVLAELYNLDGINIDFENMHLKDRDLLTQFVREMTPLMHEQGLTVSIDVTIRSTSENWSMIYDRVALGEIVDYMAVMTYDEHWAASPRSGSVASLPWVERGLVGILEQVPKEKVLLGIPFYTRVWEEEKQADGSVKVSSRALSMSAAENMIRENNAQVTYDEQAQQDYAEWTKGNTTYKIWLENEESIRKRVQLARKYDLAGVASWRRGFEKPEIWDVIKEELNRR